MRSAALPLLLVSLTLSLALACAPPAPGASPPAASPPAAPTEGGGAAPPTNDAAASAENPYLAKSGESPTNIRVATCAVSGGFIHLYTALEGNLFSKYGLNAEHLTVQPSAAALTALTTNEIQFLYCAADATIPGLASGVEANLVAAPLVGLPYVLVTRPEVRTIADLRGKSLGVARVGDLSDRLSKELVQRHGMVPNQDVYIRPIGGSQPERYRAVLADIVQGIVITPPLETQARKDGLNVVYDLAQLGLPFVYSSVHASNEMIRSNPQLVQRMAAVMAEAVHFTEKNPDVARQALRKVLQLEDQEALDSAYQAYAQKLVNRRMVIPFDAVNGTIEDARATGTQVTVRGAEDIATNTFVDDLDRTGFLQRLWGPELSAR